jgi:hypothetical protein
LAKAVSAVEENAMPLQILCIHSVFINVTFAIDIIVALNEKHFTKPTQNDVGTTMS